MGHPQVQPGTLDLQWTVKVLVCEDPDRIRATFHLHRELCDMWMDYRIVANFLWNVTEEYHIVQNGGGRKLWRINRFQSFGEENVGKFKLLIFS